MSTRDEILAKIDALMAQADSISNEWNSKEDPMPSEVSEKLSGILGKVDEWRAQLGLLDRAQTVKSYMEDPANAPKSSMVTSGQWRQAAPYEGDAPIDEKAWREIEVPTVMVDPIHGMPFVTNRKIRYHIPLNVQGKGYSPAFEAYLRKGTGELGPQDRKTLSEGTDSAGGFLVAEDYMTELIKKIAVMATVRARARVATTSRDIARWPKITYTTDEKYTSAVRLTWTGESPATSTVHRVTDPVFGLYSIPVHTAMASMPMSNDLIEDSAFDILGISSDLLAEAFALDENDAFLNGSGVGRPMGLLTQVDGAGPISVKSGDANLLLADGLIDVAYALPPQYETGATWLMNKATEKAIRKLKESTTNAYLWPVVNQVGAFGPVNRELLGYPVLREQFMPDVAANAYPALIGDLKGYLVLDRVGLSVQRLTDSAYAELNLTGLLARKRVGGQCIEPWRIRVQKVAA